MYNEMTERIKSILGTGKENAVSRDVLCERLGVGDRAMREAVSMARLEGVAINNDQDGRGYYMPDKQEELQRQYRQTINRGKHIFAQLKSIRNAMGIDGQISLDALLAECE